MLDNSSLAPFVPSCLFMGYYRYSTLSQIVDLFAQFFRITTLPAAKRAINDHDFSKMPQNTEIPCVIRLMAQGIDR